MTFLSIDLSNDFILLQDRLRPDVYIEVGAFDAEFSRTIKSKYPDAEVWAFEASPFVYQKNSPMDGINYINKAVSDKNDIIDFQLQADLHPIVGNNSILKRKENKEYFYIPVESVTLNDIFKDKKNICLWIDCEGANKEVLTGASKILDKVSSIFIEVEEIEYWENQWLDKDVESYLNNFGFKIVKRDSQYENQYNCIFLKEEYIK